jgi:prepilin-type N-terminal cleavage/methylation domain-containing protein
MPIYTAQMQTNCSCDGFKREWLSCRKHFRREISRRDCSAFTLVEMMVVIVIFSLIIVFAMANIGGWIRQNTFRGQLGEFVSTMQMASAAAAESDRRYEIIVDPAEQNYVLRQITSSDLSEVLQEEIIAQNNFSENCRVTYVLFDDGDYTDKDKAKFRVGHAGWAYGGRVVFTDDAGQMYSVVVNRINRIVKLEKGEAGLLKPKPEDEVPF